MKELTKSFFSYSLAVMFFGLKQVDNVLSPGCGAGEKPPAIESFDSVTSAISSQFGETLASAFQAADSLQRGMVELAFKVLFPFAASYVNSLERRQPLDTPAEPRRWTEVMEPLAAD